MTVYIKQLHPYKALGRARVAAINSRTGPGQIPRNSYALSRATVNGSVSRTTARHTWRCCYYLAILFGFRSSYLMDKQCDCAECQGTGTFLAAQGFNTRMPRAELYSLVA